MAREIPDGGTPLEPDGGGGEGVALAADAPDALGRATRHSS